MLTVKFFLRETGQHFLDADSGRAVLKFVGLTRPRRDAGANREAGQEVVAG